jgi:TonB-linked SusC/RagA family outer membrane protein
MRSKFKWIFTLLVALTMQLSFAQEKTVKGIVTDASGPMPGVNVVVKGTQRGVSTGFDGAYSIKASEGEVLVFSFMGMSDISKTVDASGSINVKMQDDAKQLETVVITGLGIKRKQDAITSSYTVVKAEELNRASSPNAVQALIGKVSGLQINTTNSSVAGENRVVFRGARSITGNNQALVVIDGAISSLATLQQIPPETILSVNAMKGAQGSAIYGSDGVNGVIIVTTKKGGSDKFSVTIKSSLDISEIAYTPIRQMRYGQGWDGAHSNVENGSWGPEYDGSLQPVGMMQADGSFVMAPYTGNQDNIKEFFNNGLTSQNGISISGGSLETGYVNFSANRQVNDFIVDGDELKRNSFLLKAGKKIGKFSVEGNLNYITQNVRQTESELFSDLLQAATNIPISSFQSGNEHHWTVYANNPYWKRDNQRQILKGDVVAAIATFGYQFNKNISASYLANLRMNTNNNLKYRNAYVDVVGPDTYGASPAAIDAALVSSTDFRRVFYGDLLVNFDYKLTDNVSLKATVGNNLQDNSFKSNEVGGTNFAIPGVYNISNVLNPYTAGALVFDNDGGSRTLANRSTHFRKVGVFASAELGYKDYLFLNATGRNDWSSVFDKSLYSFFYPSVGLSFIPTKAFESIKGNVLNYMKIFGSFTKVGNDSAVGAYAINQTATTGFGYPFGNNSYVQQLRPTYSQIEPEFVTTKEASINLGFFNDRLTLDGSYYVADTDNLITQTNVPFSTGYQTVLDNVGSLQNKGYEIDLGFTPIKNSDPRGFRWDNKLNFSHNKTTITALEGGLTSISLRAPSATAGIFADLGDEFPLIKGTKYTRDSMGRVILGANGNPTIDPSQQKLGKTTPDYILGYSPSVSYRGIKLSATMDYRTGHQFVSYVKQDLSFNGSTIESAENRGGFIMPNSSYDYNGDGVYGADETNTTVVTGGGGTASYISGYNNGFYSRTGENLVLDATAFKLREASLSYSFPESLIGKTGLSALSIGVNARNPITIFSKQNRNYGDPEASETSGNAAGIDPFTSRYPAQRSYGFSLNLTF